MKENLIKIKKNIMDFGKQKYNILMYIAFILLMFYSYNCTLRATLYPSQLILFVTFFISGFCMLVANLSEINKETIKSRKYFIVILLVLMFLVCFRNGDVANGHLGLPFYTIFSIYTIFILSFTNRWYKIGINVMLFFVLEHVLATIFCYIFPDFYYNNIMPLFPEYQKELLYQFNHKQIAGLTQHYSTNALYLVTGLIIMTFNLNIDFKKQKVKSILKVVFYIVIIIALLLTGKRAQIVFPIIAFLIVFIIKNRKNIFNAMKKILIIVALATILLGITSLIIPSITNSFTRIINSITKGGIMDTREPLYEFAISKFTEKPIVGWGWGNYKYLYNENVIAKERDYMNAHCIYLQLLSETGIIGTAIICYLFIWLIVKSIKLIKNINEEKKLNSCYFFLAFHIYFLLEGIFGNSLYDTPILIPYCIICSEIMYVWFSSKNKEIGERK